MAPIRTKDEPKFADAIGESITKAEAMETYQLSSTDLDSIAPIDTGRSSRGGRVSAVTYNRSDVEALSQRLRARDTVSRAPESSGSVEATRASSAVRDEVAVEGQSTHGEVTHTANPSDEVAEGEAELADEEEDEEYDGDEDEDEEIDYTNFGSGDFDSDDDSNADVAGDFSNVDYDVHVPAGYDPGDDYEPDPNDPELRQMMEDFDPDSLDYYEEDENVFAGMSAEDARYKMMGILHG
ncbi:hypothetical protein PsYK624_082540 [Phanerochaete sordida]|uniref:Uncharacterized protein n=1 Tax=Phanerochaete sordida TaxID=48140 RepID=A0A9P3GC94_9APHY|nr:hypothetical protein PsYK624_082540 [Phanerochaete sordida]